jgi:hypothetical protein
LSRAPETTLRDLEPLFVFGSENEPIIVDGHHRLEALKRGGWSISKVREQRVYWRGDSKPDNIDPDIRSELIDR